MSNTVSIPANSTGAGASLTALLMPLIAADGPVARRLKAVDPTGLIPNAAALLRTLQYGLKTMSEAPMCAASLFYLDWRAQPDRVCEYMLLSSNSSYSVSPILRDLLLYRVNVIDRDKALRQKALAQYQDAVLDYDLFLGDLIPDDIRREGHAAYDSAAFDKGMNQHSLADWGEYKRRLSQRSRSSSLGIKTGFEILDRNLRGLRGAMYLAGATGIGKTTLVLNMVVGALRQHADLCVLWYSLETPKETLFDRLLCIETGLDYEAVTGPPTREAETRIGDADSRLRADVLSRLRVKERLAIAVNSSLETVIADDAIETLKATGAYMVLIVIDYFQIVPVPEGVGNPLEQDAYRVNELQKLLQRSKINDFPMGQPILVVTELRKKDATRGDTGIADLMGSSRLGYSAEAVLILEADDSTNKSPIPVTLRIAKGRDGVTRSQIPLHFDFKCCRFLERGTSGVRSAGSTGNTANTKAGALSPMAGRD